MVEQFVLGATTWPVVTDLGQHPGAGQPPEPGGLVMIWASGCRSKWAIAAWASSSAAAQAALRSKAVS
jgi:hypothetical protein